MLKELWKTIGELKTPERRLLFGIMLAAIVALAWVVKQNYNERTAHIQRLEFQLDQCGQHSRSSQALMQDKLDQCHEESLKMLKEVYEYSEQVKIKVNETLK